MTDGIPGDEIESREDAKRPVERLVILRNCHGVEIREDQREYGHYKAVGAICFCGEDLIVAPPIFNPNHKKGDPVMVCRDHGIHAYRFSELVMGKQSEI